MAGREDKGGEGARQEVRVKEQEGALEGPVGPEKVQENREEPPGKVEDRGCPGREGEGRAGRQIGTDRPSQ